MQENAEDLLQEIMVKTHKNLLSIKEPEKSKAWLFQIARTHSSIITANNGHLFQIEIFLK